MLIRSFLHAELKTFQHFNFPGRRSIISDRWWDCFTIPVLVTSGRPCYAEVDGFKINTVQPIAAFFGRVFPDPLEATIATYPSWMQSSMGLSHSIAVGRADARKLHITFMRTVRVSLDSKIYEPPVGLGTFPLFDIEPYRSRLPPTMVAQGGIFIPMYGMFKRVILKTYTLAWDSLTLRLLFLRYGSFVDVI